MQDSGREAKTCLYAYLQGGSHLRKVRWPKINCSSAQWMGSLHSRSVERLGKARRPWCPENTLAPLSSNRVLRHCSEALTAAKYLPARTSEKHGIGGTTASVTKKFPRWVASW